jgi:hypothetical protein
VVVAVGLALGLVLGLTGNSSSASAGPLPGIYRGLTSQQQPISFTVTRKNQIDDVDFKEQVTCTVAGQILVSFAGLPTTSGPLAGNGVFAIDVTLPEQTFRMVGTFANGQFTGGYRHTYKAGPMGHPTLGTPTQTCDSNQVKFAATRQPR